MIHKSNGSRNSSSVRKLTLEIAGMTCEHCAIGIKNKIISLDGILDQDVNYKNGVGNFKFDSEKVSKNQIIEAVNSMKTYRVTKEVEDLPDENEVEPIGNETKSILGSGLANGSITHYDLIIIGGGSAAFAGASTAAELGLSVLMVNAGLDLGGTCVNVGCVPSKFLIRNAEQIHKSQHSPFKGVSSAASIVDYKTIITQKKELVAHLQKKKYLDVVNQLEGVDVINGWARFLDEQSIEVNGKVYTATKFLLATGATTNVPAIAGLQEVGYLTNETLFDMEEQPKHLIILGAGYIAIEIAQAYNRFGTKVTILHRSERILRAQEADITDELTMQFKNEGIDIRTNVIIEKFEREGEIVRAITNQGEFEGSHVLVATGAKANTFNMTIEKTGLSLLPSGHVIVNERQETNINSIYAAGDCTNTPAFVYTAAKEGKVAVSNAFKSAGEKVDYTALPWVVFTDPQIAGAGLDEKEAEKQRIPYETSIIPLTEVPRAQAAMDTRGFIKLIRNTDNDKLIGGRIIAPEGGELAMQISLAIKAGMTIQQLADSFHPYLTLSEGIKLAAITFNKDVSELSCCAS